MRGAAVEALAGMVTSDESMRQAILTKLEDPEGYCGEPRWNPADKHRPPKPGYQTDLQAQPWRVW